MIYVDRFNYIAGYILKRLNKNIFKNCHNCLQNLCIDNISSEHIIILAREYTSRLSLKYPSIHHIYIGQQISTICHHTNICETLSTDIKNNFTFKSLSLFVLIMVKILRKELLTLLLTWWLTTSVPKINIILLRKKNS